MSDLPSRRRPPPPFDPIALKPEPPASQSPFEPNDFEERYFERSGEPGLLQRGRAMIEGEERERDLAADAAVRSKGMHFDPRPDVLARTTDERGMTLPELNLKAQFIKSRNLWDPEFQPSAPGLGVAGTALAGVEPGPAAPFVPYPEKQELRNETPLTPSEQKDYERWARSVHKNPKNEEQDYDLKGYWKDVVHGNPDLPEELKDSIQYHRDQLKKMGPKAHLPDMYKKPNHPTFSDESLYHGPNLAGDEPTAGGHWDEENKTFTPGPTNQVHWNRRELQDYFDKYEKGYTIKFPDWYQ